MKTLLLSLLAGALVGAGLAVSGMVDPTRVVDFLDVTGDWDPTLAFVMAGAVLVFAAGRLLSRGCCEVPDFPADPISRNLIVGATVFGIGWGLGGFCPGPSLANLGGLRVEAFVFVPAMAAGMFLVQRVFGLDR